MEIENSPLTPTPEAAFTPDTPAPAAETVPAAAVAPQGLERQLEHALNLARQRDGLIDRLHKENQLLRQGELRQALLPLLRDLVRLHDDLGKMIETEPPGAEDLTLVREALTEVLNRYGITSFAPVPGEAYDSARHAVAEARASVDPSAERTVAAVTRVGFQREDGSIVRAAEVAVYRYQPPPSEEGVIAVDPPGANGGLDGGAGMSEAANAASENNAQGKD
jgi:molecular chaperone GrpE (heat shock protein)